MDQQVIEEMIDEGLRLQGLDNPARNQRSGGSASLKRRNKAIVRWYVETNVTLKDIAERFGESYANVNHIINQSGVPRRQPGKGKKK